MLLAHACGFSTPASEGGDDDIPPGMQVTLVDDTAADFAAHTALTGGVVAARGAIEPEAFVLGGLRARAYAGNNVADDSTFDSVAANVGPVIGTGYRQVPADWANLGSGRPKGLGLTSGSNFTLILDGEVLLPAGSPALVVNADDRAVVQVALDGTTFGPRLFSHNGAAMQTLAVTTGGWYPIRIAYGQAGGAARLVLSLVTPNGTIPVDSTRLRVNVTSAPGVIVSAFNFQGLGVPLGEAAQAGIDSQYGLGAPPLDLDIPIDGFSMRYAGQLRIDTAGAYTFAGTAGSDASDTWRLWIDDHLVASGWTGISPTPQVTLDLTPGWHDLLVDLGDSIANAQIGVTMSGPGIAAGPIASERLRPAVAFGLTASFASAAKTPLVDASVTGGVTTPGIATVMTPLSAPPGAVIDAIDHGFSIESQRMSDITVDRLDCHGSTPQVLAASPGFHYVGADLACAGTSVTPPPAWGFRVVDNVPGNDLLYLAFTPAITNVLLVATYHGGERAPFSPAVTFVSTPRPTPGAIGYGKVALVADARGAMVVLAVRTGADAAALAASSWVEVDDGKVPQVPAGELIQYQVTITGTGWQLASVDRVALTYVVPGP